MFIFCCLSFEHQNHENINQSYLRKLRKYDAISAKLTNLGRQASCDSAYAKTLAMAATRECAEKKRSNHRFRTDSKTSNMH